MFLLPEKRILIIIKANDDLVTPRSSRKVLLIKLEMIMHVANVRARRRDVPRGPRPKLVDT